MEATAYVLMAGALVLGVYTYLGYPVLLWLVGRFRSDGLPSGEPSTWPTVSISVPVYNEERQVEGLLESLLQLDYPRDRLQILVISDASTDRTDEIVRSYVDRGVEFVRMPERGGKTKVENAAAEVLTGEIVVNTDASIRIAPDGLRNIVRAFQDPEIGLASGRDVSVGPGTEVGNFSESGYVGYEMGVRDLETRVGGIIGASGCFYAIRSEIHRMPLPAWLCRDFAAALHAREAGLRPVSVSDALCYVPRTGSLEREYRRKVRTMAQGMTTLWHKRALLDPFTHGFFAVRLWSHKVFRWLLPWALAFAWLAAGLLAPERPWAAAIFAAGAVVLLLAAAGWALLRSGRPRSALTTVTFAVAGNVAAMHALLRVLRGERTAVWEPTRR
jgi:cellulose synthase/poly-beta-1,6-N-acetylglucosamine synthase-like glycosyltransferase